MCVYMFKHKYIYNYMKLHNQYVHPHKTNDFQTYNVASVLIVSTGLHLASLPVFLCPALEEWPLWTASRWLLCPLASSSVVGPAGEQTAAGETSSGWISSPPCCHTVIVVVVAYSWSQPPMGRPLSQDSGGTVFSSCPLRPRACHSFPLFYLMGVSYPLSALVTLATLLGVVLSLK